LSQCGQPTRPTETKSTKSKQLNDKNQFKYTQYGRSVEDFRVNSY